MFRQKYSDLTSEIDQDNSNGKNDKRSLPIGYGLQSEHVHS